MEADDDAGLQALLNDLLPPCNPDIVEDLSTANAPPIINAAVEAPARGATARNSNVLEGLLLGTAPLPQRFCDLAYRLRIGDAELWDLVSSRPHGDPFRVYMDTESSYWVALRNVHCTTVEGRQLSPMCPLPSDELQWESSISSHLNSLKGPAPLAEFVGHNSWNILLFLARRPDLFELQVRLKRVESPAPDRRARHDPTATSSVSQYDTCSPHSLPPQQPQAAVSVVQTATQSSHPAQPLMTESDPDARLPTGWEEQSQHAVTEVNALAERFLVEWQQDAGASSLQGEAATWRGVLNAEQGSAQPMPQELSASAGSFAWNADASQPGTAQALPWLLFDLPEKPVQHTSRRMSQHQSGPPDVVQDTTSGTAGDTDPHVVYLGRVGHDMPIGELEIYCSTYGRVININYLQ
ncbi:hypothetical protein CYMTET_56221, partial [Cymbomonas tetramitiformis]